MKTITLYTRSIALIITFFAITSLFSQTTIDNEDFETGWFPFTMWNDGGNDCSANNGSLLSGVKCINLQDDSDANSSSYTNNIDLTPYASVDITFDFRTTNFKNNHDFFIEFSNDGGSNWNGVPIAEYDYPADFSNSTNYTNQTVSIISGGTYTFTNTSRFRFRCDAKDDSNDLFLDNIHIQGYIPQPEIDITGLGNSILNGDVTPATLDNTDYGTLAVSSTTTHTFSIDNTGNPATTLTISDSGSGITISGGSGYFSINTEPAQNSTINGGNSLSFSIDYNPLVAGTHTATVSIDNDDSDENPYTFTITGNSIVPVPEINITGNGTAITDGDLTPSITDHTDFGNVNEAGGTTIRTFTIENTGTKILNLTGSSPFITIGGTHAADFSVTAIPSSSIATSASTTFNITFDPSAMGLRSANISIANDDSDENPYNFNIQGYGVDACGGTISSYPYSQDFETGIGFWQQDTGDNFDWTRQTGTTPTSSTGPTTASNGSYYMFTEATSNTSNTANIESPCFDLTGTVNPRFTFFYHMYGSNMGTLNVDLSTDGGVTYTTSLLSYSGEVQKNTLSSWIPVSFDLTAYVGQTIKIRIQGITGSNDTSDMAIDNVSVTNKPSPTYAPGGITSDLSVWLKANDGLSYSDGQSVTVWEDQGIASNVRPHNSGQEPTYRDNPNRNVNFNPVVEFDNVYSTFNLDTNYSYDDVTTEFLEGDFGYYTQDIFVVIIPDETVVNSTFGFMDVICADSHLDINSTDTTGFGFGDFTGRINGETICYAHDTYQTSESGDGYAVSDSGSSVTYDNVGIINPRNNAAATQQELYYNAVDIETTQNDVAEFLNSNDTRFWIGRSEGWKATTNARIGEVISYSARKDDDNLTEERNRIQSYLAVKYGITLGVNGTSQDYVDSDGAVIWDNITGVPADDVFNYDIAGIGRDDASELYQKQSRSVNKASDIKGRTQGVLTMGISSIHNTNNLNPNTLIDKQFLMWGNDGVDLEDDAVLVDVDMSTDISPAISNEDASIGTWVQFNGIARTWKVVEKGGDMPSVEVAMLTSAIRTATPPDGTYLMFISDTPNFDPTADYRIMTESTNELGQAIVKTNYDFDNTKYITFGWAPEREFERSIYFDPADKNYVDIEDALDVNSTQFTISSWIMRGSNSSNTSIVSKRDAAYTDGYDFKITSTGYLQMSWGANGSQNITSNVPIPVDEWHQVAVIYNSGTAKLYIDGVESASKSLSAPTNTNHSFYIGAAAKHTPEAFFHGNIDEVRVWETALTVAQLKYIMNQEIEENSNFVGGSYLISKAVTPTKNDISILPWSKLAGYYPMSIYTYTNTKDESGNGHQGALRNLRTVDRQTAPLPYQSTQDGDWDNSNTWINGDVQTIPGTTSIVDNTLSVDWNLVRTTHDVTIDDDSDLPSANSGNRSVLGLFVDSNEITVNGDTSINSGYGLTVTHYLNLDGDIDLEGESQLIQTLGSDLAVTSAGKVERDQQGTADTFIYNYWSSPVGIPNTSSNNNSYTLPNVMRDGTQNINWLTSGYNGTDTAPVGLADYWVWQYANQLNDTYASWQHVRSTGTIQAGEGYTMKGPGSGTPSEDQNYVFVGKPNNGDINLTLSAGNDYLIGNPYASAIDANEFILDNISSGLGRASTNIIDGSLYFWEHFANATHNLAEYEGGYATRNLLGGVKAISNHILINNSEAVGEKTPQLFIPVSQGFFVIADTGGNISFKNNQRVFQKEGSSSSIFMKTNEEKLSKSSTTSNESVDSRERIWLMFDSSNGYHRQLLAAVDENATQQVDIGFDALLNEDNAEDMFWMIENDYYVIQGVSNFDKTQVLPLGVKTNTEGEITIRIDELQNISESTDIYVHDTVLDTYHDLRQNDFNIYLTSGIHASRFEIVFETQGVLGLNDDKIESIDLHYSNTNETIILVNPNYLQIDTIELFDMLGKSILRITEIPVENTVEIKASNLSSGTYILKASAEFGITTKKVIIN